MKGTVRNKTEILVLLIENDRIMDNCNYTFLLPAFKTTYLQEAILSIKNQSFSDFRVIVSDDASPYDIKTIFDITCGDDERFSYRRNEINIGSKSLVSHWNQLVDMCSTEYLIMASDDDIYDIHFLKEIDKLVQKYPNVNIFRAKAQRIVNENIDVKDGNIPEFLEQADFLQFFGEKKMVHCLANYVFRTNELKKNGYFPDFPKAAKSDSAAAMLMSKKGIAITRQILFTFRISSTNLSSPQNYNKYSEEGLVSCIMFADWFKHNIKPYINYSERIKNAHYHHVTDVALFFLNNLSITKSFKYLYKLWIRGFISFRFLATVVKNRIIKWSKE